jgi:hypothetical protein
VVLFLNRGGDLCNKEDLDLDVNSAININEGLSVCSFLVSAALLTV